MPVPVAVPVAIKVTPIVLLGAPMAIKFVVPTLRIVYSVPGTMLVAAIEPGALLNVTVFKFEIV